MWVPQISQQEWLWESCGLKCRSIKFVLTGKPGKYVSGKDIIIHIIGKIGVDGALYKSMEFTGDEYANLSMDDRFTMANMAIEAGAKNRIFPVDDKTIQYLNEHTKKEYTVYEADEDAEYEQVVGIKSICRSPSNRCIPTSSWKRKNDR